LHRREELESARVHRDPISQRYFAFFCRLAM